MKCEICGLKDAVIHIRQIQKDLVHELHICEECAQEKGLIREEESELPICQPPFRPPGGQGRHRGGRRQGSVPAVRPEGLRVPEAGQAGLPGVLQGIRKGREGHRFADGGASAAHGQGAARRWSSSRAPAPRVKACATSCARRWSGKNTSWRRGCATA